LRFRVEALKALPMENLRLIDAEAIVRLGQSTCAADVKECVLRPIVDILLEPTDPASLGAMLRSKVSNRIFIHRELREVLQPAHTDPAS
jgi:hypothetical protein